MKKKVPILLLTAILYTLNIAGQTVSGKTAEIAIQTSGHCGECKKTIEHILAFEKGIKEAQLDIATGILTVSYNTLKTDPDKIRKAVSRVGYDADSIAADPKAYEKLKACCKKDGMKPAK